MKHLQECVIAPIKKQRTATDQSDVAQMRTLLIAKEFENETLKMQLKILVSSMKELEEETDEYEQDVAEAWRDATARIRRMREVNIPFLQQL